MCACPSAKAGTHNLQFRRLAKRFAQDCLRTNHIDSVYGSPLSRGRLVEGVVRDRPQFTNTTVFLPLRMTRSSR